jgi:hypothetical protein
MAAEAIIRHCLQDKMPQVGARAAATDLELTDYEALLARRRISTGIRQSDPASEQAPLYRQILGEAWSALAHPLQMMHDGVAEADGRAIVECGKGVCARLLAYLIGFPPAGEDVPVSVAFRPAGGREHWQRTFGAATAPGAKFARFSSIQEQGRGRFDMLLCERFGPMAFGLALVVDEDRLRLVMRGWSFLGVPLPLALAPRIEAYEFAAAGRFNFHVEINHSITGLIVRYRGFLVPRA